MGERESFSGYTQRATNSHALGLKLNEGGINKGDQCPAAIILGRVLSVM